MNPMQALEDALKEAGASIEGAGSIEELDRVESSLLGKSSAIGGVRRAMGGLDPAERPVVGARLNEVTESIQGQVAQRR
ncbi:MAG TPA: phenylalanine--tRNA ligase subunit alpha, partial [Acidimicrobiia bacterium]